MPPKLIFELRAAEDAPFLAGGVWRFRRGEQWVVTGPNGCGKSHLAALLAGAAPARGISLELAPEVEGRVAWLGFAQQREQMAHGWLQERWHWYDPGRLRSAGELLSYEAVNEINPFEVRPPQQEERAAFALRLAHLKQRLELAPLFKRQVTQLSNGEMRRVLLARALLLQPLLLVLDDPFAGLDSAMVMHLKALLLELVAQGVSLVLMSRNADENPPCMTHLLELREGRIVRRRRFGASGGRRVLPLEAASAGKVQAREASTRNTRAAPLVLEMRNVNYRVGGRSRPASSVWYCWRAPWWRSPNCCCSMSLA